MLFVLILPLFKKLSFARSVSTPISAYRGTRRQKCRSLGRRGRVLCRLDRMMDIAARSLKIKRTTVGKLMEEGLYPYTKRYLGSFDNHFSTIGLLGMNEAGLNAAWLRKDLAHEETQEFAVRVLNHMRERLSDYQEQYGDLYNLEAPPAESASYRLVKHDKVHFSDIITAHEGPPITPTPATCR